MKEPEFFLAYAPRGPALRCALFYLSDERDLYGWFTGLRPDATAASCYFVLEDFHSSRPARYEAVDSDALHSAWLLDEARRHELARVQEAFAREWLFYRDDTKAVAELEAYADAELATGEVNVRFQRLSRFSTLQPNWTLYSPHFERTALRSLAKRWPLEYRIVEPATPPRRRAARSCP